MQSRKPPIAAVRTHVVSSPHGERPDPYYWLRDDERTDPEVLAYLAEENAFHAQHLAPRSRWRTRSTPRSSAA